MRIIGLDPGLAHLGICILTGREVEAHKLITSSKDDGDEAQRVQDVASAVETFIEAHNELLFAGDDISMLAIEAQHFEDARGDHEEARRKRAAKAASTIQVAHVAGAVMAVAARFGLEVILVTPSKAKKAITGRGDASKEQVRGMAAQMAGVKAEEISEHEADATAVACGAQNLLTDKKLDGLKELADEA